MDGSGVSLRLRQVQVIDLAVMQSKSAFDKVEGGWTKSEGFATGFRTATDEAAEEDEGFDGAMDNPPPVKKPKPTAKAKAEVVNTDDILTELDALDFEDA